MKTSELRLQIRTSRLRRRQNQAALQSAIRNLQSEISRFDGGLVDQHHRDIVLDGVDAMAGAALQRRAILHERDGRFAVRTGKNFKQFRVDGHAGTI